MASENDYVNDYGLFDYFILGEGLHARGVGGGGQDCMLIPPIKFICILNPLIEKEAPSSPSQELTVQKS